MIIFDVAKKQVLLWINILILIIVVAVLFIPLSKSINQLAAESEVAQTEMLAREKAFNQFLRSQNYFNTIPQPTIVETSILAEDDIVTFVETMERLALEADVTQQISFQSDKRTIHNTIAQIPLTIRVTGNWNDVLHFLKKIESEKFYLNPTIIRITPDAYDLNKLQIELEATTIWLTKQ